MSSTEQPKSPKSQATRLFEEIQKNYKPIHFPSKEEVNEAITTLTVLVMTKPNLIPEIISKAKIIGEIHGDHKTKVSNLIANKFWEHDFGYGIQANKYKDEE